MYYIYVWFIYCWFQVNEIISGRHYYVNEKTKLNDRLCALQKILSESLLSLCLSALKIAEKPRKTIL